MNNLKLFDNNNKYSLMMKYLFSFIVFSFIYHFLINIINTSNI